MMTSELLEPFGLGFPAFDALDSVEKGVGPRTFLVLLTPPLRVHSSPAVRPSTVHPRATRTGLT